MNISNRTVFLALLAPAPWFCEDFIPSWFALFLNGVLALRIFWPLPSIALFLASFGASYLVFKEYNYRWVPETSIAFLNAMLAAKLGKSKNQFSTEIIIGLLWTGSFAIFNNTLYYLLYLGLVLYLTTKLLKRRPEDKFHLKDQTNMKGQLKGLAKALPLIIALFVFFPRFRGFFPTAASSSQRGEVGYSKTINNSSSDFLNINNKTAFFAQMDTELPSETLYWRGRSHAHTDGYNWRPAGAAPERGLPLAGNDSLEYVIKKELPLEGDLPLLETPIRILSSKSREYKNGGANTYSQYQKRNKSSYRAVSSPAGSLKTQGLKKKRYLQLPGFLPKTFLDFSEALSAQGASELVKNFSKTIRDQGFRYDLNPGPTPTMSDFIQKKVGFCTHYASLLGLVLRHHGVPARLISGFQGGEYNQSGGFYTVRSSDAHAWVEYLDQGQWKRADPTGFISPDRIQQGGHAFLTGESQEGANDSALFFLRDIEQYLSTLNYKLALFFDDFDRDKQSEIAQALKMDLKGLYWLGAGLGAFSLLLLFYFSAKRRARLSFEDREFSKFLNALKSKGLQTGPDMSEGEIIKLCEDHDLSAEHIEFIKRYQELKYGPREIDPKTLRALRKRLN